MMRNPFSPRASRRSSRGERQVEVVLYSRAACPLCDEMLDQITRAGVSERLRLTVRDVDSDLGLRARYGLRVPVLSIEGEDVFEARLDADEFRAAIEKAECEMHGETR